MFSFGFVNLNILDYVTLPYIPTPSLHFPAVAAVPCWGQPESHVNENINYKTKEDKSLILGFFSLIFGFVFVCI